MTRGRPAAPSGQPLVPSVNITRRLVTMQKSIVSLVIYQSQIHAQAVADIAATYGQVFTALDEKLPSIPTQVNFSRPFGHFKS